LLLPGCPLGGGCHSSYRQSRQSFLIVIFL
jgi:hypothetical protein